MNYIREFLDENKMNPINAGIRPDYTENNGFEMVLFDVYGTLLQSSSGDVDQAHLKSENILKAFEAVGLQFCIKDIELAAKLVLSEFKRTIADWHSHNESDTDYLEVDIIEVWEKIIQELKTTEVIEKKSAPDIAKLAFIFEILCNPVSPMPGMKQTIETLASKKIPLGIVSNAQFYTPITLNYFLTGELENSKKLSYFENELCVFSYQKLVAKPDTFLFREIIPEIKNKFNLELENVLYLGNDMLKDVYPAQKTGMKTALFAGDKRSLKFREECPEIKDIKPDFIITDLPQIIDIV